MMDTYGIAGITTDNKHSSPLFTCHKTLLWKSCYVDYELIMLIMNSLKSVMLIMNSLKSVMLIMNSLKLLSSSVLPTFSHFFLDVFIE